MYLSAGAYHEIRTQAVCHALAFGASEGIVFDTSIQATAGGSCFYESAGMVLGTQGASGVRLLRYQINECGRGTTNELDIYDDKQARETVVLPP
jgi:hypothetical protein